MDTAASMRAKGFVMGPDSRTWTHHSRADIPPAPTLKKKETKPAKVRKQSPLEAKFERLWQEICGPELTPEFKFYPTRRWRFDFACERAKIAVELDGGVWGGGRHTRGSGFIGDCEKGNAACSLGWRVWHLATGMVTRENLMQIRAAIAWHDEAI